MHRDSLGDGIRSVVLKRTLNHLKKWPQSLTLYLFIFGVLSIYAIGKYWEEGDLGKIPILTGVFITLFVGYRFEIGVDWVTYELIFLEISRMPLIDTLSYGDAAYSFVNWAVSRAGGQIWHVNLICAAIFSYGLIKFCSILPRPALALAVSIPMLVVVTAMGYTRQATAVGCIMLAFTYFKGTINWRWMVWLSLAILFHRSAIFAFPFFVIAGTKRPILSAVVGGGMAVILLYAVVLQNIGDVLSLYFEGDIESSGTIPRIAIGALVGISFFYVKDRDILGVRHDLVKIMAIAMIILLPLNLVIPSTVVDRIGVLLLPSQAAILAAVAASLAQKPWTEGVVTVAILSIYAAVFLIWLLFATFATYWIPYENVFFVQWV